MEEIGESRFPHQDCGYRGAFAFLFIVHLAG
jgi:hypothetical protein